MSVDLSIRDPNDLNNYIQIEFDNVLAEPDGTHSPDCVWRNSFKCFKCGKNNCYKVLTFLFGIFIALFWGCCFACLSFSAIWCYTPYIRALHIITNPIRKIYKIALSVWLGPVFETIGLIFSRIHVTNSEGQAPKPFDSVFDDKSKGRIENFK